MIPSPPPGAATALLCTTVPLSVHKFESINIVMQTFKYDATSRVQVVEVPLHNKYDDGRHEQVINKCQYQILLGSSNHMISFQDDNKPHITND